MMMKKLAVVVILMAVAVFCCQGVIAEDENGVYALMTIPYSMFYEAETTGGRYDSVSSATRVKPLLMDYAGGSFHYMTDGREITGVIFPVYAESEEMLKMYGGTEVTDKTSVTITVKVNGKKTKTTYKGKDALFQSYPFSYYRLSEVPAVFKRMGWDSIFGPMEGLVIPVDGEISLVPDQYAQVCLSVEGVADILSELNVNAVVLAADDGTRVGMKHIENIWLKTFSGFNFDSEVYTMLKGKHIGSVEFYTFDAKYVVTAENGVDIP